AAVLPGATLPLRTPHSKPVGRMSLSITSAGSVTLPNRARNKSPGTKAHDLRLDLEGQLVRVAVGPARAVGKPFQTDFVVAREDLVAGLARDTELTAQHRHLLPIQQPGDELEPFIHLVTLLPGHFCSPRKRPGV